MCERASVRACERASVRACVCVCVCVSVSVSVCLCVSVFTVHFIWRFKLVTLFTNCDQIILIKSFAFLILSAVPIS